MWLELLFFFSTLLIYLILKDRKPSNCPPGDFEIPFIGGGPILDEKSAQKLKEKYGDIAMHRTGNFRTVFLFDYKVAKEVMSRLEFSDRPKFMSNFSIDDQKLGGVVSSNGPHWQHDRRFVLRNLRNLGMGKSHLEEALNVEARALVQDLRRYDGEAIHYPDSFRTVALNIIWQMIASTRYDLRSKEVDSIYAATKAAQDNFKPYMFLPSFLPALNYLPKCVREFIFKEHFIEDFFQEMRSVVGSAIDKHLEKRGPENPRDLIDEYIKEMKESEGDEESFFRRGALDQIVTDMFQAGSDTVNHMLKWVAYFMARYPQYTRRMQLEIDAAVPRDRLVSLDDRHKLPLVEGFTTEALRMASLLPNSVQRSAARDTTIEGYFIPKGTIVSVATYAIHHDPRYWQEPHEFRPERHLDETGTKFSAPKQGFFAFGSGRRLCAGELLARMELLLFTAAVAQNFDVAPADGVDLTEEESYNVSVFRLVVDRKLKYIPRA